MLVVVVVGKILQDASRLEDVNGLAIIKCIGYGRNTAIGVDFKEPWLLLLILAEFELLDFVWEAADGVSFLPQQGLF